MTKSKRFVLKKRSSIRLKNNTERLVVSVVKSNKNLLAQVFDRQASKNIWQKSTASIQGGTKTEKSQKLSEILATFLKEQNISTLVFNRNGYLYHGRVAAFAEGLRNQNIVI